MVWHEMGCGGDGTEIVTIAHSRSDKYEPYIQCNRHS